MFEHLVVPVDISSASLKAIPIALRMAEAVDGTIEIMTVVDRVGDVPSMQGVLRECVGDAIRDYGPFGVEPQLTVDASDSVAAAVARRIESTPGAMALMSSHGHGRSAAILGSTVDELLRATFGPIIVVGPHAGTGVGSLDGTYVVPLDGSRPADDVLPIVGAWTVEFGGIPWLVDVLAGSARSTADLSESSLVNSRATKLARQIRREVNFEVLHGAHPARAITEFAADRGASLIFMATHGRTGLDRLHCGSVAADVVRHAACPVVLFRPPELVADAPTATAGATA